MPLRSGIRGAGAIVAALTLLGGLLAACGDNGPGTVRVLNEAEASPSASASPGAYASPSATAMAGPGVVMPQPDGTTRVNVTLREWAIVSELEEVDAGRIYFFVENAGPDDPHEFLVIRIGDAEIADIPVVDGRVPEDEIDFVDEIEPFATGSSASIVLDLPPGKYLLLCNIAEIEDGELESHYELGMRTRFNVK